MMNLNSVKVEIRLDLKMYCWNMKDFCMLPSMLDVHLFLQDHCYYFSCIGYKMFLRNRIKTHLLAIIAYYYRSRGWRNPSIPSHILSSTNPETRIPSMYFHSQSILKTKNHRFCRLKFLGNHVWLVFREELATIGYQSEQHRLSFGEWDSIWWDRFNCTCSKCSKY